MRYVPFPLDILLHNHPVGMGRHRRACEYPACRSRSQSKGRIRPRKHFAIHRQAEGNLARVDIPDGVAVHGRDILSGHACACDDRRSENPASRLFQRQAFATERRCRQEGPAQGLIEINQGEVPLLSSRLSVRHFSS